MTTLLIDTRLITRRYEEFVEDQSEWAVNLLCNDEICYTFPYMNQRGFCFRSLTDENTIIHDVVVFTIFVIDRRRQRILDETPITFANSAFFAS